MIEGNWYSFEFFMGGFGARWEGVNRVFESRG